MPIGDLGLQSDLSYQPSAAAALAWKGRLTSGGADWPVERAYRRYIRRRYGGLEDRNRVSAIPAADPITLFFLRR